ncbi:MAG: hypothetical protein OQL08_09015 [Gammaproteobacteria bacterium]|nr:hypothetical protein [Gammaproteobacteria bacterium]
MCEIHVLPTCKVIDIDSLARRMGLKPATVNGRTVLLTPHHERLQALRNAARFGQGGKVVSTWPTPQHDDYNPEPPAAA